MDLNDIRTRIDALDDELSRLFIERMRLMDEVARSKSDSGKAVRDHARERAILNRVTEPAGDALAPYVRDLYKHIFELSRSRQSSLMAAPAALAEQIASACRAGEGHRLPNRAVIACQGAEGAYAQQACEKLFAYPEILYFSSFDGVFSAVEKGMCPYGVLPLENSTAGSVAKVYDLMQRHAFHIVRACRLRIDHRLMRRRGASGPIREIVSHEQALRQCSAFFAAHPEYKPTEMANTAVAAEFVARSERDDLAVIASATCADAYGLEVISDSIGDARENFTRFICISREPIVYPGANKISISFDLPHEPGSLSAVLMKIALADVNLTKLESRPVPGSAFDARFFLDMQANLRDENTVRLLTELNGCSEKMTLLGAYEER